MDLEALSREHPQLANLSAVYRYLLDLSDEQLVIAVVILCHSDKKYRHAWSIALTKHDTNGEIRRRAFHEVRARNRRLYKLMGNAPLGEA